MPNFAWIIVIICGVLLAGLALTQKNPGGLVSGGATGQLSDLLAGPDLPPDMLF